MPIDQDNIPKRIRLAGCLAGALALLVLTSSPRLGAQELDARQLFISGNEALSAGRHHEALALFLRSLALNRRPSTILNIAQCYRLLDFPERAVRYYRRYLRSHGDAAATIPYRAEVREHLGRLQVPHELLEKARALQREGVHRGALKRLRAARQLSRWPGIDLLQAQSYLALGKQARALAAARRAAAAYERHLQRWGVPGAAPQHVRRQADAARVLVRRLQAQKVATKPEARPPSRSRGWLITSIVAGALAVAAEIAAVVFYQQAEQLYTDDPTFHTYKKVVIAGHISAGVLALFAGTSVVLHFTLDASESSTRARGRGALVTATFRF